MSAGQRNRRSQAGALSVAKEELIVRKRSIERGRVRVTTNVRRRNALVQQPLERDFVEIDRVPTNGVLERAVKARYEGDVLVIPVLEEVAVMQKQLVLKEELRIRKRAVRTLHKQRVRLRAEEVNVERLRPRRGKRS